MHEEQEEKRVGKAAEPTGEELEFIYSRLERMSDSAILEEMQDAEFPVRTKGFITRRRKEFGAAKKVLIEQTRREQNPLVIKAREEHLDEVARLIGAWRNHVGDHLDNLPTVERVVRVAGVLRSYNWLEAELEHSASGPLTGCLREHLPFPTVWQSHSTFIRVFGDYVYECGKLARKVREEGETWPEVQIRRDFELPVLWRISERQSKEDPSQYNEGEWLSGHGPLYWTEHTNDWEVLKTERPQEWIQEYEAMSTRLLVSDTVANLISSYLRSIALAERILDSLNEILIRRDYVVYSCRLCPGAKQEAVNQDTNV